MVHPECNLASACTRDFVTDLDKLHQQLDNTLLMLNVDTKLPLIPDDYQLWNSRLEAKLCQAQFFHYNMTF